MTDALTAAIPEIMIICSAPAYPKNTKLVAASEPIETPINKAGEKTPPKRPKPMQSAVIRIFAISNRPTFPKEIFPAISSLMASNPNPRISGKITPTEPQISAAAKGSKGL